MAEDLIALARKAMASSRAGQDPDYPRFHLAPPVGRLNDPNGLLVDGDTYHAFYQFGPFHPRRKLVFWGHASSHDLLTWEQHDPAIIPDSPYDRSGAYSGSALVLAGDEAAHAPDHARFQLFYTGNLKDPTTDARISTQALASSRDLARFTATRRTSATRRCGATPMRRAPSEWSWARSARTGPARRSCTGPRISFHGASRAS